MLDTANLLYLNPSTGKPKPGYTTGEAGILTFGRIVNNLPTTYDLKSISVDELLALLPREFEEWLIDEDKSKYDDDIVEIREVFSRLRLDAKTPLASPRPEHINDLLLEIRDRPVTERTAKVRSRLFRQAVIAAYESKCAISGLELTFAPGRSEERKEVEAAHIKPIAFGGRDLIQNGIALNRTVHWAFDLGMMWIDQDLRVVVCEDIENDYRNAWLKLFAGNTLNLPDDEIFYPDTELLRWHRENVAAR